MKSKLSTLIPKGFAKALIGCTLLTLLTPTSLLAQVGSDLSDADYLTRYGTSRRPQTCPSRSEPRAGRLSVDQAIKYTRCWQEATGYGRIVTFVDISNFKLSAPRRVTEKDSLGQWTINRIDPTQPMYDIKARAVRYSCSRILTESVGGFHGPGKNCSIEGSDISDSLNGIGICFKELTETWSCRLTVIGSGKKISGSPPAN
jgi:hypothetical protein